LLGGLSEVVAARRDDDDPLARLLMLGPGLTPGEVELIEDVRSR
jgi:hypothetical protein